MKPCLNFGHTGAASNVGLKQMQNLKDVTDHVFEFFAQKDITFSLIRKVDGNLIPGGVGCFKFARAGEGIYYSNGLPVVFVTRLSSESGCDANVGKWYRKQWYYENICIIAVFRTKACYKYYRQSIRVKDTLACPCKLE